MDKEDIDIAALTLREDGLHQAPDGAVYFWCRRKLFHVPDEYYERRIRSDYMLRFFALMAVLAVWIGGIILLIDHISQFQAFLTLAVIVPVFYYAYSFWITRHLDEAGSVPQSGRSAAGKLRHAAEQLAKNYTPLSMMMIAAFLMGMTLLTASMAYTQFRARADLADKLTWAQKRYASPAPAVSDMPEDKKGATVGDYIDAKLYALEDAQDAALMRAGLLAGGTLIILFGALYFVYVARLSKRHHSG